jgi:ATP-dependent Lhr-like helicase
MEAVIAELGMQWQVGIRNGDTDVKERERQKRQMPEVLIITPESLHLLLAQKNYPAHFKHLQLVAIDEWHELIGSKRGVLVELALSRLVAISGKWQAASGKQAAFSNEGSGETSARHLQIWGISATIGNLEQSAEVLLSPLQQSGITEPVMVRAAMHKRIRVESIIPDEIEKYPWAGHLGIKLAHRLIPIIRQSRTTLIFINTRGMSETWYQVLLNECPELAGAIALHHSSVERELRDWVEENLHTGKLKAVVCTASLDLGVDFRPVETVIQVGSPKGVARFLQRAGRSGHQPDAVSTIYFLPTHSLELVEAAALKEAAERQLIESRAPRLLCFDVLCQYLCTLAISDGFEPAALLPEIRATFCFREMSDTEWQQVLQFVVTGGAALGNYDEYKKVEILNGLYRITGRRIAMRHRMHIGTIVSDAMLKVKFAGGGYVGVIEEYFISRLQPGEVFALAGRHLELVMIKEMTAIVRKSAAKKAIVPSWGGGRMPLSSNLGRVLRDKFGEAPQAMPGDVELQALQPLFRLQAELSHIPGAGELLVEQIETKDGFHLFAYPFEGRQVHEVMAALLAYRISRIMPITFSFAMNDYGFELLSDQPIPVDDSNVYELFTVDNLLNDIQKSINATEMARRKFRDIAVIGGLIFQGYPGEQKKARHLQASAGLLFNVFSEYDAGNLLLRQAYSEVFEQQVEEERLRSALQRIAAGRIVLTFPQQMTPFCFPIKVDSMRETVSSEKLEDRVRRMQEQLRQ